MLTHDLGKTSTLHGPPILKRLEVADPHVVEVGVLRGKLSNYLLRHRTDLKLWMVDPWRAMPEDSPGGKFGYEHGDPCNILTQEQHDDNRACALNVADHFPDRATVVATDSTVAATIYESTQFDMVFLDGGHWHDQVIADLNAWWPRVKPGGWIGGHDYGVHPMGVEVPGAVDPFFGKLGLTVETDSFYTWFARKPIGGDA